MVQANRTKRFDPLRLNRRRWSILGLACCMVGVWLCEVGWIFDRNEENMQFRRKQSVISIEDILKKKLTLASSHLSMKKSNDKETRPVMHTFFHRIPKAESITGMSDEADTELLRIWEESWQSLGWETRVLTLKDAEAHPDFEKWKGHLDGVWLGKRPQYDRMCYYRWLAMSMAGGGWMSDYDLMPLPGSSSHNLDTMKERFTVHDETLQGDAIPSLLSGSQQEWERMAGLLLDNAIEHKDDKSLTWVDMRALIDIYKQEKDEDYPYDMIDEVIIGHLIIPKEGEKLEDSKCLQIRKLKGVHICHHAMKSLGYSPEDRPRIAKRFTEQWKKECEADIVAPTTKS